MAEPPSSASSRDVDLHLNFEALSLTTELPDSDSLLFPSVPLRARCTRLESFTLFPKLPLELRDMVWALTFTKRRVHIHTNCTWLPEHCIQFKSNTRPPAIFHTNTESRAIGLKSYIVLLRHRKEKAYSLPPREKERKHCPIYFHPEFDTVVLPDIIPMEEGSYLATSPHVSKQHSTRFSPSKCATCGSLNHGPELYMSILQPQWTPWSTQLGVTWCFIISKDLES